MPSPRQPSLRGFPGLLALALAIGIVLAGRHALLDATREWDYNAIRLQRSFVLAAGGDLYPSVDEGALLNTIYGPVGAAAYLPATLIRSPVPAIVAAQLLSLAFVLVPPLVLHLRPARAPRARLGAVFGGLFLAALVLDLRPLEYVAFTVHVDAPALALAFAAWALAVGGHGARRWAWWRVGLASTLAVLAVWTKLMALPLLAALPLWAVLAGGWRAAGRYGLALAVAGVAVSSAIVVRFGPVDDLVLNLWTVPSRHTGPQAFDATAWLGTLLRFLNTTLGAWLLALFLLLRHRLVGRAMRWTRQPLWVWGLPALALLPLGILGLHKQGGDVNALSYSVYFLVIGTSLELARLARSSTGSRRLAMALPTLVVALVLTVQSPASLTSWRQGLDRDALPVEIAYDYARAHPRTMYFPRLTLVSLLADGEIHHQSVGLLDRGLAGMSPTREHLLAHLPSRLEGIAFADNPFWHEIRLIDLPEYRCLVPERELPGFLVFRRCPP